MSGHACERCGYESGGPKGRLDRSAPGRRRVRWRVRRLAGALHRRRRDPGVPVVFVPVLVVVCAFVVDRRMRRRAAIAARADYEYRQQMLGTVMADHRVLAMQPPPRRQAADHPSVTEPILRRR